MERYIANKLIYALIGALYLISLTGCDIKKSDLDPEEMYFKIYDNRQLDESYYPLDLKQTDDGGFLILASLIGDTTSLSPYPKVYLLKTSNTGEKEWDLIVEQQAVSPVANIVKNGTNFYIVCMDDVTLNTKVFKVNLDTRSVELAETLDLSYPLFAEETSDGATLLVSYDRDSRSSKLTRLTGNFAIDWSTSYFAQEDKEEVIISHLTRRGKTYPFFAGEVGDGSPQYYFVNCIYNYSMTLNFVNSASGGSTGRLYGIQLTAGVSSATYLDSSKFAVSIFHTGDNFILPGVELQMESTRTVNDFEGKTRNQELTTNAKVQVKKLELNGKELIVYVSQTKTNQLTLYFYSVDDYRLVNSKYYGSKDPIEVANFIKTDEGGIAIAALTYIAGRFPRIELIKIAPKEL